jgi:hypothetical protein
MALSGLFFALIIGLDSMGPFVTNRYAQRFVGLALLGSVFVPLWPRLEAEVPRLGTRHFANAYTEEVPGALAAVAAHTTPTDMIFTDGTPLLYVQSNRVNATRESTIIDEAIGFYDGDTDAQRVSGLRAELERNMPKIVVLDPAYERRKARHRQALIIPFITAHGYKKLTDRIWLRPY